MGLWYIMSFSASCVSSELGESGLFRSASRAAYGPLTGRWRDLLGRHILPGEISLRKAEILIWHTEKLNIRAVEKRHWRLYDDEVL